MSIKNISACYLSIAVLMLLSACSLPTYFLPAAPGNDIAYLPKPMGSDSSKVKNYVSASLAHLSLPYTSGGLDMGFLNYSRAHTTKNLNIAYGAFGFLGSTSIDHSLGKEIPSDFIGKNFSGGGLRTSLGYYDVSGNAEFRILSWENALSWENGSYADFRKAVKSMNNPDTIASTKTTIYTTGLASEIIWHAKRNQNNQFAFRIFYGFTPGLKQSLKDKLNRIEIKESCVDFSFFFKLNKFYGIGGISGTEGLSSKFSLGYTF